MNLYLVAITIVLFSVASVNKGEKLPADLLYPDIFFIAQNFLRSNL
jgi:hypothetical protein